jgi:endonuclease/exonuclease/phosphatase family metal-dependent hydrolase
VRLATWNLESFDDRGPLGLDARVRALRPMLERLAADVLCLQEVGAQKVPGDGRRLAWLDALVAGTAYESFHRFAAGLPSGGLSDVHNLVVLSRAPFSSTRAVAHALVPAPVLPRATAAGETLALRWDRPLLEVAVGLGRHTLHVIAAHLRAPLATPFEGEKLGPFSWRRSSAWAEGFFAAGLKRTGQALEARLLVDARFDEDPDALVLVAGDLNAELDQTPLRILRARVEDTGSPALASRALTPLTDRVPAERRHSLFHEGRPQLVDHLLASRALAERQVGADIFNDGLGDEWSAALRGETTAGSFHAPVVAEVSLAG